MTSTLTTQPDRMLVLPDDQPTPPAPLAFVDVETDGLRPDCKVWEVAIIRREPDGSERTKSVFVEVGVGNAESRALDMGGYYDRHPEGRRLAAPGVAPAPGCDEQAFPERSVARTVARWTRGAHLVGVNPAFDAERLDRMLRRHGLAPGWHYHLVDVLALAAGHLQLPPPWKSDDLAELVGVEVTPEDRHTALGDARWTARIYDAVMGGGPR